MKPERTVAESILTRAVSEAIDKVWPLSPELQERMAETIVAKLGQIEFRPALRALAADR